MKKVAESKEVQQEVEKTKVTYSIEDVNQLLTYLGGQKFSEVAGIVEMLKTRGELS